MAKRFQPSKIVRLNAVEQLATLLEIDLLMGKRSVFVNRLRRALMVKTRHNRAETITRLARKP